MVISQFGWTKSFLNFVEHGHFSIWWNTVNLQLCGAQSICNSVEHSHSQIGWSWSFLNLVEHSHFTIWWNTVILNFVEHSLFVYFSFLFLWNWEMTTFNQVEDDSVPQNLSLSLLAQIVKPCKQIGKICEDKNQICIYQYPLSTLNGLATVDRDVICQFLFQWIYYCHGSKYTGKKTGKTHLSAVACLAQEFTL